MCVSVCLSVVLSVCLTVCVRVCVMCDSVWITESNVSTTESGEGRVKGQDIIYGESLPIMME